MYTDLPGNQEEDVRNQPEAKVQAPLKQEEVQPEVVKGAGEIHEYATKYATALGIVHIGCGVVTLVMVAAVITIAEASFLAVAFSSLCILPSVFFIVSGSVAIRGASQKNRCLISATQTLSILSAIVAALLLIGSLPAAANLNGHSEGIKFFSFKVFSMVGVTMLIVATISATLPCLIQSPKGNVTRVQDSTSPTSRSALVKGYAIIAMSVLHLICGLLLLLADMISNRHVGVYIKSESYSYITTVTGFTFPPGVLATVGIFLVASSVISLVNAKKRSKLLSVSAMVPSVYAAISTGIILFVIFMSIVNGDYSNNYYDHEVDNRYTSGFRIGAIFEALALLITTTTTAILSSTNSSREKPAQTLVQFP